MDVLIFHGLLLPRSFWRGTTDKDAGVQSFDDFYFSLEK